LTLGNRQLGKMLLVNRGIDLVLEIVRWSSSHLLGLLQLVLLGAGPIWSKALVKETDYIALLLVVIQVLLRMQCHLFLRVDPLLLILVLLDGLVLKVEALATLRVWVGVLLYLLTLRKEVTLAALIRVVQI